MLLLLVSYLARMHFYSLGLPKFFPVQVKTFNDTKGWGFIELAPEFRILRAKMRGDGEEPRAG